MTVSPHPTTPPRTASPRTTPPRTTPPRTTPPRTTLWTKIASPIGALLLTRDSEPPRGITALFLPNGRHPTEPEPGWIRDDESFDDARGQLVEYFAGRRTIFSLPLAARGSAFQLRVWAALREIPFGQTRSYGATAQAIGAPTAARAVGLANGKNPISIIVPCHRVIGSNGSLTGYAGGVEAKRWLLGHEATHAGLFADR